MVSKAIREDLSDELEQVPQRDWKDTVTAATDIALIGFFIVGASLLIVTVGSAAATGSYAVRRWVIDRRTPPVSELWRMFLRWLLPGALTSAVLVVLALIMSFNVHAISQGLVPGGIFTLAPAIVLAAWLVMGVVLILVGLGRYPEDGWRSAIRRAARASVVAPLRCLVLLGVALFALGLAATIEATIPLVVGYGLFAVHVVADKLLPEDDSALAESHHSDETTVMVRV